MASEHEVVVFPITFAHAQAIFDVLTAPYTDLLLLYRLFAKSKQGPQESMLN